MTEAAALRAQGEHLARELFGTAEGDLAGLPLDDGDDLTRELVTWVFGYLLKEQPHLTIREKVLCLISMCTVRSHMDMLRRWIPAARNAGCTREEVHETMVTMLVYGGWPATRLALEVLAEVWPRTGELKTANFG